MEKLSHMEGLKERLLALLEPEEPYVITPVKSAPHILNLAFKGLKGEVLLRALEAEGVYISTGSACSSKARTPRIHQALGLSKEISESAVRVSFSPDNTVDEIEEAAGKIRGALQKYRYFVRR